MNESINTLINQLVDAGTLNNLQAGFVSKGLRLQMGEYRFKPGVFKVVNTTGEDLQKGVFPLPTKDPSPVLFQLLGMLIESGMQLASISEIMVGKMPGQNTPATTTQETVQQGEAVFTAIYKRVYRSFDSEIEKIHRLVRILPAEVEKAKALSGIQLEQSDFDLPRWMIIPGADPVGDSTTVRQAKYQFLMQNFMPLQTINPIEITKRVVADLDLPDSEMLVMQPQPQPDPEMMKVQAQMQLMQQKAEMEKQMQEQKMQHEAQMAQMEMQIEQMKLEMKAKEHQMDLQIKQQDTQMSMQERQLDHQFNQQERVETHAVNKEMQQDQLRMSKQQGDMKLKQSDEQHKQKLKQTKETQAAKPQGGKKKS
jgi:chaperonin GroES